MPRNNRILKNTQNAFHRKIADIQQTIITTKQFGHKYDSPTCIQSTGALK